MIFSLMGIIIGVQYCRINFTQNLPRDIPNYSHLQVLFQMLFSIVCYCSLRVFRCYISLFIPFVDPTLPICSLLRLSIALPDRSSSFISNSSTIDSETPNSTKINCPMMCFGGFMRGNLQHPPSLQISLPKAQAIWQFDNLSANRSSNMVLFITGGVFCSGIVFLGYKWQFQSCFVDFVLSNKTKSKLCLSFTISELVNSLGGFRNNTVS
jgi:hypothetical protein